MPALRNTATALLALVLAAQIAAPGTSHALARGRVHPCAAAGAAPCAEGPCDAMPGCGGANSRAACARACDGSHGAPLVAPAPSLPAIHGATLTPIAGAPCCAHPIHLARAAEETSRGRPAIYLSDHSLLI